MTVKKRAQAREVAVQALYQFEVSQRGSSPHRGIADLEPFLATATSDAWVRDFARRLVDGVLARLGSIDETIRGAAERWKLERIALVDRSILRLATYELLDEPDVPPKVAIDEAIELAKKYSTAQSGAFVNGVLDRIYRDIRAGSRTGTGN